ncbi:MAG: L,D-transpeptidase family protein, partial [Novosphingobium sp.]
MAFAPMAIAAPTAPAPTITPAPVSAAQPVIFAPAPGVLATPTPTATDTPIVPIVPAVPRDTPLVAPVMHWPIGDARTLLSVIGTIDNEGLIPADYQPDALEQAIAAGEGAALDTAASTSFAWLTEDLRDGRAPMNARLQWFAFDKDRDVYPTEKVMAAALDNHDIAGALLALDPTYPDYTLLRETLAQTPKKAVKVRDSIRANMDRWRWFSRDLGEFYLMTNIPEFQLRLVRKDKIIRTYRTIVGRPGKTATPQLAELVQGVIFNPTWTVPQSIV